MDDTAFDDDSWPATTFNYEVLPTQVKTPALVLYRYYRPKNGVLEGNPNDEPVYITVDAEPYRKKMPGGGD